MRRSGGLKKAVDIGSGFVVFIGGSVSAAMAAGGQIADLKSEGRDSVTKRRSVMKLQRTFICIAGVFFAVGFTASQAAAGGGTPGCGVTGAEGIMEIEVNALRAGGKTIVTTRNDTTKVTAKARILKGTADGDTTIVTTLLIEAFDGEVLIGQASRTNITLGVGKGGKGATLTVNTPQCDSGMIELVATFKGTDGDNDLCMGKRILRKECR